MSDVKEGPYKVLSKLVSAREPYRYSIVFQEKRDTFMSEIVPDAGLGETARLICNLMNIRYNNRAEDGRKQYEMETTDENTDRDVAGSGLRSEDQRDGG